MINNDYSRDGQQKHESRAHAHIHEASLKINMMKKHHRDHSQARSTFRTLPRHFQSYHNNHQL